jgi:sirohydrochlorin ferrochelatase
MAQGIRQVIIIPLFLLPGVHVKEDLPHEIRLAASRLPDRIRLVCTPYLGSHASFKRFVSSRLQAVAADRCILLAHGSRRPGGNRSVQQLSTILGADVAFWATAPDLESQVFELMAQGHQLIAIAPHFLFPGSITDAIARRTEALAERLPHVTLRLLPPLGTSTELARVVCEIASSAQYGLPSANRDSELRSLAPSGITA